MALSSVFVLANALRLKMHSPSRRRWQPAPAEIARSQREATIKVGTF